MLKSRFAVLCLLVCLLQTSASKGEVLLGNLGGLTPSSPLPGALTPLNSPLGSDSLVGVGSEYNSKAVGFRIPNGLSYRLDVVEMWLRTQTNSVPEAMLYSHNPSGYPGSLLETLVYQPESGASFATFQSPTNFQLNAGQVYWIVLHNQAAVADTFSWQALVGGGSTPTGSAAFVGLRFELNAMPPKIDSSLINYFEISATPDPSPTIPEPSSLALMLVAGGAVVIRRWRRDL